MRNVLSFVASQFFLQFCTLGKQIMRGFFCQGGDTQMLFKDIFFFEPVVFGERNFTFFIYAEPNTV